MPTVQNIYGCAGCAGPVTRANVQHGVFFEGCPEGCLSVALPELMGCADWPALRRRYLPQYLPPLSWLQVNESGSAKLHFSYNSHFM